MALIKSQHLRDTLALLLLLSDNPTEMTSGRNLGGGCGKGEKLPNLK